MVARAPEHLLKLSKRISFANITNFTSNSSNKSFFPKDFGSQNPHKISENLWKSFCGSKSAEWSYDGILLCFVFLLRLEVRRNPIHHFCYAQHLGVALQMYGKVDRKGLTDQHTSWRWHTPSHSTNLEDWGNGIAGPYVRTQRTAVNHKQGEFVGNFLENSWRLFRRSCVLQCLGRSTLIGDRDRGCQIVPNARGGGNSPRKLPLEDLETFDPQIGDFL